MKKSRLSRRSENQSKKSLFLSLLGMVIILIVFMKFGIPFLVNFTLFISGAQKTIETTNDKKTFMYPPILDVLPTATNSARTTISGTTDPEYTINLYINDDLISKKNADKNGSFAFKNVKLSKGENVIKVKATKDKNESTFSNENSIFYTDAAPILSIDTPTDGKSFSKDESPITVSGKTDPGAKVTINDLWAIVRDDGTFSYSLPLKGGENEIKIVTIDQAGNKTEATKKVTYNQ